MDCYSNMFTIVLFFFLNLLVVKEAIIVLHVAITITIITGLKVVEIPLVIFSILLVTFEVLVTTKVSTTQATFRITVLVTIAILLIIIGITILAIVVSEVKFVDCSNRFK